MIEDLGQGLNWSCRIDHYACPAAVVLNEMQGAVQVDASLLMHRNPVGPSVAEFRDELVRILDHEVTVEGQVGRLAQRLHQRRPHGQIGDKVAVHNIHMDNRATACCGVADLVRQMGEVSRQNRGCEFNQPGSPQ